MFLKERMLHLAKNIRELTPTGEFHRDKKISLLKMRLKNIEKKLETPFQLDIMEILYDMWNKDYLEIIGESYEEPMQ